MAELQKNLFTKRWRKVEAPTPSELQLQISLIAQLRLRARPGVIYYHVPNGELRDKRAAAKLKAMGTLAGVADLVFVWADSYGATRNLYLELKAHGRKLTPEQTVFAEKIRATGAVFEYADTIDDAIAILKHYRIIER